MIKNWETRRRSTVKQTLIVTGRMLGSGKTAFGENLFNFNNPVVLKEFEKIPESPGKQALIQALTVKIDLKREVSGLELFKLGGFRNYLSFVLRNNTLTIYIEIALKKAEEFWWKKKYPLSKCIKTLVDLVD